MKYNEYTPERAGAVRRAFGHGFMALVMVGVLWMVGVTIYRAGARDVLYRAEISIEPGNVIIDYNGHRFVHGIE